VTFGLRPEHIGVGAAGDPAAAQVAGRVMLLEPLGSDTLGVIKLGSAADAGEMTGRFPPDAGLRVGQNLQLSLGLNRFHLFDAESGAAIRGADW